MFRNLFAARRFRSPDAYRSRRLELEALEDRVAPASGGGPAPFPAPIGILPNFQPTSFASFSATMPSAGNSGFPSFVNTSPTFQTTGFAPFSGNSPSFGSSGFSVPGFSLPFGSSTAVATNGSAGSAATLNQLNQMEQMIGQLFQLATAQNPQQAANLVLDEFFLAIETFTVFRSQAQGTFNPTFQDLPARENAINQNPVEQTQVGRLLGSLVFETTATLLAAGSPGAGVGV
jgi:hypothetical protein